ncbi:MAG: BLUF domain-containing protein [Sphingomonadaceae bacterium]|nr:BLUF domain-containing protein [Sphingomonadaceae bacterium]
MLSLIYVSTAAPGFREADLAPLAQAAATANAVLGVTGMLAYNGAHFMQLLEGEEAAVEATLARIAADPRHAGLVVIRRETRAGRECPDWSMRAFLTPLSGAGAATRFAADLPDQFEPDTRVVFTSFASLDRKVA